MPDVSGMEATRALARLEHGPAVVTVSAEVTPTLEAQLREAGAAGVVDKTELFERLLPALHAAAGPGPRPVTGAPERAGRR